MAMTPPDDSTFWGWMAGVFAGLSTLVFKAQNEKISRVEKQARDDHDSHDKEITRLRGHAEKLFDKLEDHARASEARHVEMMRALHDGLNAKADK
jgi:hypothetical protein